MVANMETAWTFSTNRRSDSEFTDSESVDLHKKLLAAGVKTAFITVEGGLHGGFEKEKNTELNKAMMRFIMELKNFK